MPELPDLTVYLEALQTRIVGTHLERIVVGNPFLLRTAVPPLASADGRVVRELRRVGKRIAIGLEGDLWLVIHLMIAGRLHWFERGEKLRGRAPLARFEFERGTLTLTEAGTRRRASLQLLAGHAQLDAVNPGGLEVLGITREEFAARLQSENHTLKRALTDPRLFSGIGNAYSDEILHQARLSPLAMTRKLQPAQIAQLFEATRLTLANWTTKLRAQAGAEFPEKVTAFRPEMAVHGRFGEPCPQCRTPVQRVRYAENETNYCPRCQTEDRVLADRSLSRLLKDDWPRTVDELERNSARPV
ncbi:MAG TPA: DNA-formamidopyrimidine glycosylase family protein [Steroidobacteraceae bacterium]